MEVRGTDETSGVTPPPRTGASTSVLGRLVQLMLAAMDDYTNSLERVGGIIDRLQQAGKEQKAANQLLTLIKGDPKADKLDLETLGQNWNMIKGMLRAAEKKSPGQRTPLEKQLIELLGPSKDGQQNFQAIQAFMDKASNYDDQIDAVKDPAAREALRKKLTKELLSTDLPAMRKKLAAGAGAIATSLGKSTDSIAARLRIEATLAVDQMKQIEKLMNRVIKAFQKILSKMASAGAN